MKKQRKLKKWVKVALVLIGLIAIIKIGCIIGKEDDKAIKTCINNGNNKTYCEQTILGVY